MLKSKKNKLSNLFFGIFIVLLIIPQTRQPIQVFLQKGLAMFSPSVEAKADQKQLESYQWKLTDLNGVPYDFKSAEGKVVLINFWATWCPPCIAEMPSLVGLHNDYKGKIEFLFVSNEDKDVVEGFLKKRDFKIKVYQPISSVPEILSTSTIPRTLLISKAGKIVIDKTGASNWNSDTVRETIEVLLQE
ncbi:thiol:disulfide isomerase-like thioredoxin [Formosa agariphila KMM 3901]|uniref:Thiol:disulfide isomerase-like thioredoxin n=1 Tax=Formosa agariphila (strain DSM 15362 / KCTC 12365 / LMG 23005 / KMM 3901 / M-2Alg 35-1) TaxID=1347342 RepID=T2KIA0_FORAG|nr:TlpA disulfide reductase family protein [Formosa agariphila]CDF78597.1 thiol:disulfide isomerase-like thioredoxin [Formosa agariphila KMM 3901]